MTDGHFREHGINQAPAYSVSDMIFVRWHNPSQALIAKRVSYPQLTATHQMRKTTKDPPSENDLHHKK